MVSLLLKEEGKTMKQCHTSHIKNNPQLNIVNTVHDHPELNLCNRKQNQKPKQTRQNLIKKNNFVFKSINFF